MDPEGEITQEDTWGVIAAYFRRESAARLSPARRRGGRLGGGGSSSAPERDLRPAARSTPERSSFTPFLTAKVDGGSLKDVPALVCRERSLVSQQLESFENFLKYRVSARAREMRSYDAHWSCGFSRWQARSRLARSRLSCRWPRSLWRTTASGSGRKSSTTTRAMRWRRRRRSLSCGSSTSGCGAGRREA